MTLIKKLIMGATGIITITSCAHIEEKVSIHQYQKRIDLEVATQNAVISDVSGTWAKYWKETNDRYELANFDHQNTFLTINKDNTFLLQNFMLRSGEGDTHQNYYYSAGHVEVKNTPELKYPATLILHTNSGSKPHKKYALTINKPVKDSLTLTTDNKKIQVWSKFNGQIGYPSQR